MRWPTWFCALTTDHLTSVPEDIPDMAGEYWTCHCGKWGPAERDETLIRVWNGRGWSWV